MANLSYVRFQNTYKDLQDCNEHIEDKIEDPSEKGYRKKLIQLCKEIAGIFEEDY